MNVGLKHGGARRAAAGEVFGMALRVGARRLVVYGGPFRAAARIDEAAVRVKVAAEQRGRADLSVDLGDFLAPSLPALQHAAWFVLLNAITFRRDVFVGCGAGLGRTGTVLAAVAKVAGATDPVAYVREHYRSGAVETREQVDAISRLDVTGLAAEFRARAVAGALVRRWTADPLTNTGLGIK